MSFSDLLELVKLAREWSGEIVSAGVALGVTITGKKGKKYLWAPEADGLPQYATRVCGVANGIGLAYLVHRSQDLLTAPDFTILAIWLGCIGGGAAIIYLICWSNFTVRCEGDPKQYVAGLWLRREARQVLKGKLRGLPDQYAKIHSPLPVNTAEFFCKSGKDPDFVWPRSSHVTAQVLLFAFYGFMLVPLSLAVASVSLGLKQVEVVRKGNESVFKLPAEVLFEFDKADLQPNAGRLLDRIAADLREHKVRRLRVEGHTDSIGSDAYNQKLSQDRAEAVKRWLQGKLGDVAITAIGFGKSRPIVRNDEDDAEGRAKDRRVEIVVEGGT
jgi:flagellar motor protein MotB